MDAVLKALCASLEDSYDSEEIIAALERRIDYYECKIAESEGRDSDA